MGAACVFERGVERAKGDEADDSEDECVVGWWKGGWWGGVGAAMMCV